MTAEREPNPSPPAPPPPPPAPPPPPDPDLHERLLGSPTMRLVGLAGQAMGNRYRRVLAEEDGLSPGAAGVLNALAWGQGRGLEAGTPGRATHSELAQRCMITPATLTGLVSTLEKAGYVAIRKDFVGKRPRTRAAITRSGRRAFEAHLLFLKDIIAGEAPDEAGDED